MGEYNIHQNPRTHIFYQDNEWMCHLYSLNIVGEEYGYQLK